MIKLFASDFDNTLSQWGKVSEENQKAVQSLADHGVAFCIATGRVLSNVKHLSDKYCLGAHRVATNGAVAELLNGERLYSETIAQGTVAKMIAECRKRKWYFFIYDDRRCFIPEERYPLLTVSPILGFISSKTNTEVIKTGRKEEWRLFGDDVLKVNIYPGKKGIEDALVFVKGLKGLYITSASSDKLEIMSDAVNKWKGILAVASALGIKSHEIAAIGDFDNDLPMIQNAQVGFAVANGSESVKSKADFVVPSVRENGVAKAIYRILAENERETHERNISHGLYRA